MKEANKTDVGTNCEGKAAGQKVRKRRNESNNKNEDRLSRVCVRVDTRKREEDGGARVWCSLNVRREKADRDRDRERGREKGVRREKEMECMLPL